MGVLSSNSCLALPHCLREIGLGRAIFAMATAATGAPRRGISPERRRVIDIPEAGARSGDLRRATRTSPPGGNLRRETPFSARGSRGLSWRASGGSRPTNARAPPSALQRCKTHRQGRPATLEIHQAGVTRSESGSPDLWARGPRERKRGTCGPQRNAGDPTHFLSDISETPCGRNHVLRGAGPSYSGATSGTRRPPLEPLVESAFDERA